MSRPFIKWVGGKARAMKTLLPILGDVEQRKYIEPFLGGGSVFLRLCHEGVLTQRAHLSDANERLALTWLQVKYRPFELIEFLRVFQDGDSRELFEDLRSQFNNGLDRDTPGYAGAVFIYLNRACYNGLYRENRKGEFNASFAGEKARTLRKNILFEERILAAHAALKGAQVRFGDFEAAIDEADTGALIYADPPYHRASQQTYNAGDFGEDDQRRLATALTAATQRGARFVASNADTELIRDLYRDFHIFESTRVNTINTDTSGRASKPDVIITSFL